MMIVKIMGGLGNQMFQYALGRRLSIENHTPVAFDISWFQNQNKREFQLSQFNIEADLITTQDIKELHPVTRNPLSNYVYRKIVNHIPYDKRIVYKEQKPGTFDPNVFRTRDKTYFDGYWQSEQYFDAISSILKNDFSIRNPLSASDKKLADEMIQNPNSVMVHVRRGDYTVEHQTIIAHYVCTPDYYHETMALINKRLRGKAKFYLFTDDPRWCEGNLFVPSDYLIVSDGERLVTHELVLMSKCNHAILSNSSFSWWGDWLSDSKDKNVYFPKLWFNRRSSPDLPRKHWIAYQHNTKNDWKYIDIPYAQSRYFAKFGKHINFDDPQSFTEKIQWLKIYNRKPGLTKLADKYLVREYVAGKIGEKFLTKLYNVYKSTNEIDWNHLPQKFVLKANHGSGWNILCRDKRKLDKKNAFRKLQSWLNDNYYYYGREWVYKNITPKIVCEEYLAGDQDLGLLDYKIYCFNGHPRIIQVDIGRYIRHTRVFFDLNWKLLDFTMNHPKPDYPIARPKKLDEMIEVATTLAENLEFTRVDLYSQSERIIFGELTFYPEAGFCDIHPRDVDDVIGGWLQLPTTKNTTT